MKHLPVPTTEAEFRAWFENSLGQFDVAEVILSQEACPDYVVRMKDGSIAKVEAELFDVNFAYHKHDPSKVDWVVCCYARSTEILGVPVRTVHKLWMFDRKPAEPLP